MNESECNPMDLKKRIEHLKRLRDELRRELLAGLSDELALRKRMVELAQEISELEGGSST